MAGVRDLAARWRGETKDRRRYIPQAVAWLNQERWKDVSSAQPEAAPEVPVEIDWDLMVGMFFRNRQWPEKVCGPDPMHPDCRAPAAILEKYRFRKAG